MDDRRDALEYPIYHSGQAPDHSAEKMAQPSRDIAECVALGEIPDQCTDGNIGGYCFILLRTEKYAPSHQITLRNDWDGWMADIYGAYFNGTWVFQLDPARYPQPCQMRFVLDGVHAMIGEDLPMVVLPNKVCTYSDATITFPPHAQRYPHGLDNLITVRSKYQQDVVRENHDPSQEYDIVIVGSGMGGGVLADALSDRGKRVLVLEAGSLLFPTHIDNLPGHAQNLPTSWRYQVGHFENEEGTGSQLAFGVQMNLGGRSVFWEGLIPRVRDCELEHWPMPVADYLLNGGYDSAEQLVRKRQTLGPFQNQLLAQLRAQFAEWQFCDLPRSSHQPNLDAATLSLKNVLQSSTGVFSTADLLLDSLAAQPPLGGGNLTINLNHLVTQVETSGTLATAVLCEDLVGGTTRKYRGKVIVLAAGSLESSRIALASSLRDPSHKIGVGLTDHPTFVQPALVAIDPTSPFAHAEHRSEVLVTHPDGRVHPYQAELLINPRYWGVRHSDDDLLQQAIAGEHGSQVAMNFSFGSPLNDRNYVRYNGPGKKLRVHVEHNAIGLPWQPELIALRNDVFAFLGAQYDPAQTMYYLGGGTVHHAGGTLRMSDRGDGVVDENLRFAAYDNLYCCDLSVIPYISMANPALTLVALAQRLAEHLSS